MEHALLWSETVASSVARRLLSNLFKKALTYLKVHKFDVEYIH